MKRLTGHSARALTEAIELLKQQARQEGELITDPEFSNLKRRWKVISELTPASSSAKTRWRLTQSLAKELRNQQEEDFLNSIKLCEEIEKAWS